MKILAIGDFHGKFPKKLKKQAKKVDLILSTGDLGGSKELLKIIFKYFKQNWWDIVGEKKAKKLVLEDHKNGRKIIKELSKLNKKTYIISGNWDFDSNAKSERTAGLKLKKYSQIMKHKKNLIYTNRSFKKISGLNILFFGGMVTAGAYTNKGIFDEKERKKYIKKNKKQTKQIMKYSKRSVDILFTHYPPYGYFDKVKYKEQNPMKNKHVGFKGYTEFIKKNKPKLFICGHMHEYQGKKQLGKTTIIATGPALKGQAVLIDIGDKNKKIKNIKFIR